MAIGQPPGSVDDDIDDLEALLQAGREGDLQTFLTLLHPADVADLLEELDDAASMKVLQQIDLVRSAELLSELDKETQDRVINVIQPARLVRILGEMESDDVADFLQRLPRNLATTLLKKLPDEEQDSVRELLGYDPESAGGRMQTELVAVREAATVSEALDSVRASADEFDILSVFVVDEKQRYLGNVPLQALVFAKPETSLEAVMEGKIVDVTTDVDQEEVAQIFDKYSLHELAVVDRVGRLRGRITADDIHEVLVEEAEEDIMLIAGTVVDDEPEIVYTDRVVRIVGARLPWLLVTALGALVASAILRRYAEDLIWAVSFVPIITGLSGNVGTQSAMIMIRGIAAGHIEDDELSRAIMRDVVVGTMMAGICGALATGVVFIGTNELDVSLCVGVSLALSMLLAALLGSVEPVVLSRFGIDPAIAAGPLITSINDITGVVIFSTIAINYRQLLAFL